MGLLRAVRGFLTVLLCLSPSLPGLAETEKLFILWGVEGRWDGELLVEADPSVFVEPYSFEPQHGDQWLGWDGERAQWASGVGGQVDGLVIQGRFSEQTSFVFKSQIAECTLRPADFIEGEDVILPWGENPRQFLLLGRGDPDLGPRSTRALPLPEMYHAPVPRNPVEIPSDAIIGGGAIEIGISGAQLVGIGLRRGSSDNGKLYLEVYEKDHPIEAKCTVKAGGDLLAERDVVGSLWLSMEPCIGTVDVSVTVGEGETSFRMPTTLVETRGNTLFLNGEPFLVKGTLPRGLNDGDAAYLRSLCANTIRIRASKLEYLEKYGFMGIVMPKPWKARFCERSETHDEFQKILDRALDGYQEHCLPVLRHPRLLIVQYANEQVMGAGAWSGRLGRAAFDRLDVMLARCHNVIRPLDLMIPHGYANCAMGYRPPDFMDIYLHNTYLDEDRGWPPLEKFMARQGCEDRPYVHTEFGANVYMPQAYLGGPNSPVLEKIHAWNYTHRWKTYLAAGTCGGTNYCFYDYDYSKVNVNSWDKGFTNFGIMTFDRKPKLACWELWHLWRDFEVEPSKEERVIEVSYGRDYWARDCALRIDGEDLKLDLPVDDFAPHSDRVLPLNRPLGSFRWRINYTTHRGLAMEACGAHPRALEENDFLKRLETRKTYGFLRELFDAEVVSAFGEEGHNTLNDLEREDGLVTVAFKKPNGVVYVTAFSRNGTEGPYVQCDLALGFRGRIEKVDEMTGLPTGEAVETSILPEGIRIKEVEVPYLPASYGQRSKTPIKLPVFKISG